jgi:hypothetical protein
MKQRRRYWHGLRKVEKAHRFLEQLALRLFFVHELAKDFSGSYLVSGTSFSLCFESPKVTGFAINGNSDPPFFCAFTERNTLCAFSIEHVLRVSA